MSLCKVLSSEPGSESQQIAGDGEAPALKTELILSSKRYKDVGQNSLHALGTEFDEIADKEKK